MAISRAALVDHDHELVARLRHLGQALDLDRNRRAGCLGRFAVFVQHGAHAADVCQHHVAHLQRAGLHQHRGHRAAALVQAGFDHQAPWRRLDRRLQFQHFGLQQHLLEQVVDALPVLADTGDERRRVAAVFLGHHFLDHQLLLDASGLASGLSILLIATTMGTRPPWRADGFSRLRHDAVVGRHHQDDDVGGLAPRARMAVKAS